MSLTYEQLDEATLRELLLGKMREKKTLTGVDLDNAQKDLMDINSALSQAVSDRHAETRQLNEVDKSRNTTQTSSATNARLRELKSACDDVPIYSAGKNLSLFLSKLNNINSIYVESDEPKTLAILEESFVRCSKTRLSTDFLTKLTNSTSSVSTFAEFREYMVTNHESSVSVYQRLDEISQCMPSTGESYIDYAARLENIKHDIGLSILAKWKAKFGGQKMEFDDVMSMVAGQHLCQAIQGSPNRDCFKFIASDLDNCWSATSIAVKAAAICDKMKLDGSNHMVAGFASQAQGNGGPKRGNSPKQHNAGARPNGDGKNKFKRTFKPNPEKDCFAYLDGFCPAGQECGWKHDPLKMGIGRPSRPKRESDTSNTGNVAKSMVSMTGFCQ